MLGLIIFPDWNYKSPSISFDGLFHNSELNYTLGSYSWGATQSRTNLSNSSHFYTTMKLIKKDIEITMDQLKELYQHLQVDLKELLESARCHHCTTGETIEPFKIILTQHNTIRLEGTCKNCGRKVNGYSFDTPDTWYKFKATKLQVEGQGGDHSEYLEELVREEKVRKERKRWIVSKAREHPVYYQIHISLEDISPKIWRRLLVLPSTSLKTLSKIIQIAMGWENYHLHQFIYEDERYGEPWEEDPDGTIDLGDFR